MKKWFLIFISGIAALSLQAQDIDQIERSQIIIHGERITIAEQYKKDFQDFIKSRSV